MICTEKAKSFSLNILSKSCICIGHSMYFHFKWKFILIYNWCRTTQCNAIQSIYLFCFSRIRSINKILDFSFWGFHAEFHCRFIVPLTMNNYWQAQHQRSVIDLVENLIFINLISNCCHLNCDVRIVATQVCWKWIFPH